MLVALKDTDAGNRLSVVFVRRMKSRDSAATSVATATVVSYCCSHGGLCCAGLQSSHRVSRC